MSWRLLLPVCESLIHYILLVRWGNRFHNHIPRVTSPLILTRNSQQAHLWFHVGFLWNGRDL